MGWLDYWLKGIGPAPRTGVTCTSEGRGGSEADAAEGYGMDEAGAAGGSGDFLLDLRGGGFLGSLRFADEVRVIGRLEHPAIVRMLSEGEERGFCWYAMERVDGPDLRAVLGMLRRRLLGAATHEPDPGRSGSQRRREPSD